MCLERMRSDAGYGMPRTMDGCCIHAAGERVRERERERERGSRTIFRAKTN